MPARAPPLRETVLGSSEEPLQRPGLVAIWGMSLEGLWASVIPL